MSLYYALNDVFNNGLTNHYSCVAISYYYVCNYKCFCKMTQNPSDWPLTDILSQSIDYSSASFDFYSYIYIWLCI